MAATKEKGILAMTIEEREVMLETIKSLLRLILTEFPGPDCFSLEFKTRYDLDAPGGRVEMLEEDGEITGFTMETLHREDILENKARIIETLAPLNKFFRVLVGPSGSPGSIIVELKRGINQYRKPLDC